MPEAPECSPAHLHASAEFATLVEQVGARLEADRAVERLWGRDHTLFGDDPAEIADRLGWLDEPDHIDRNGITATAGRLRASGATTVLWCGMGGSSLFPELLGSVFTDASGLRIVVLDSSHPHTIARTLDALDPATTVFAFASKSGSTIETRSHLDLCAHRFPGARFLAVTDRGSALDDFATEHGFAARFHANPEIGGRYSALSHFGLVPAALLGIDLDALLAPFPAAAAACQRTRVTDNPGASLAATIVAGVRAGRDKCTVVVPPEVAPFGAWLEQLVAESTGKHGVGVTPVVDEPLGSPGTYGDDRLFVAYGDAPALDALRAAGHPVVQLGTFPRTALAAEVLRWEVATALAGAGLGINPFDQPDVESAKVAARSALGGTLPAIPTVGLADALAPLGAPPDSIAIQAFVDPTPDTLGRLERARLHLRDTHGVAVTLGIGPRYLHSTGQLHKGGPPVLCLQALDDITDDLAVPGTPYSFGQLLAAQAAGDHQALVLAGQRVARVSLTDLLEIGDPR